MAYVYRVNGITIRDHFRNKKKRPKWSIREIDVDQERMEWYDSKISNELMLKKAEQRH